MERVADPAPSFALTTSSPPNWTRFVNASRSPEDKEEGRGWEDCESNGTICQPGYERWKTKIHEKAHRDTAVAANNWNDYRGRFAKVAKNLSYESRGTDDVQCRDTE